MEIENTVAIVTGGGSGIGRATALRLAQEGATIAVVDVDEEGGRETARQIDATGGIAGFFRADVTSVEEMRKLFEAVESAFGGVDIVHNNAGIITGLPRFPETPEAEWSRMLDINLRGVILGTQLAIGAMRKRGGGAIVNTASLAGIGYGFPPNPVYAASKGGVVLFTASLAPLKDSDNIRVNCVCPGVVDTPMLTRASEAGSDGERDAVMQRLRSLPMLQPDDIADAVITLIRDDSLAGRALMVRNGMAPELYRTPEAPRPV